MSAPGSQAERATAPRTGSGPGPGPACRPAIRASCESTTIQSSSTARRNSSPLTSTLSSGKSSKAVTQRGFAAHGRMHRSPKKASVRAPGPGPAHHDRLVSRGVPAGAHDGHARQQLAVALGPALRAPVRHEPQLRLVVGGDQPAVAVRARSPTRSAGPRSGPAGTPSLPSASSRPPAWSKCRWLIATTSTDAGSKPAARERRHDRRALVAHASPVFFVVQPLADPRLDQDAPGRRLDQQAVERLEEAPVLVQLALGQRPPQDPRHGPEDRAGVRAEGARLDQGDGRAAAEVRPPVDRVVDGHAVSPRPCRFRPRSKSAWKADAVGSDCPWYLDPSSFDPYGRSTGELIRKKLICPIRIP